VVVAHFYDIESGRKDLAERGRGHAHEMFQIPIPRDGGITDLLEEAKRKDRRFDVVICESIDRISRRAYVATEIEHHLEQAGLRLLAADEPIRLAQEGRRPKTATQVLTRRVKQGVAEWYVTEMLEKSWDGTEVHTEHGYNVGKPCYGYVADRVPHPVPAKRARGQKKMRLAKHPLEGPVVERIFTLRTVEHLGYQSIADRLNRDLATNPPPTPVDPARAAGRWTYSNVRSVITNPKCTGHMVWNRHARKGKGKNRLNPVEDWVWSPTPAHEALVDLETYVQAQQVSDHRERSRATPGPSRHPGATHTYPLRSYVFCALCGRRMWGKSQRGTVYYLCKAKKGYKPVGHPTTAIWVREEDLLDGLSAFLSQRVFGQYRRDLLDQELEIITASRVRERERSIARLRGEIADAERKRKRLGRVP